MGFDKKNTHLLISYSLLIFCSCGNDPRANQGDSVIPDVMAVRFDTVWFHGFDTTKMAEATAWDRGWKEKEIDSIRIITGDPANTLQLYSYKDSFLLYYEKGLIEIMKINGTKFGLIFYSDSLHILRKDGEKFQMINKTGIGLSYMGPGTIPEVPFHKLDLNFDGFMDIVMEIPTYGVHDNIGFYCFLYDPEKKQLVKCSGFPIENMTLDPRNKIIRSKHYSSICGASVKSLYQCVADSFVLMEQVIFHSACPDPANLFDGRLDHIVFENGMIKKDSVIIKTEHQRDKAWHTFSTLLWDSRKTW